MATQATLPVSDSSNEIKQNIVVLCFVKVVNGDKVEYLNLFDDPTLAFEYILGNLQKFRVKYLVPENYSTMINKETFSMTLSYKATWSSLFYSNIVFSVEKIEIDMDSLMRTFIGFKDFIKLYDLKESSDETNDNRLDSIFRDKKRINPLEYSMNQSNNYLIKEGLPKLMSEERENIIKNTALLKQQLESALKKKFEITNEFEKPNFETIEISAMDPKSEFDIN